VLGMGSPVLGTCLVGDGDMKELCEFNGRSLKSYLFFLIHLSAVASGVKAECCGAVWWRVMALEAWMEA